MPKGKGGRIDFSTAAGWLLAVVALLGGLLLEGGGILDVAQGTAALIVLGGTAGAVMVACPGSACLGALRELRYVLYQPRDQATEELSEILGFAARARRGGLVSLEPEIERVQSPFLRKALELAVDGTDIKDIREIMQIEIELLEQEDLSHARVFEAAGGYAPTIGILGAVLGLIQVMKNLQSIDDVGKGIAVAFVATVYGVGSANLFFLPAAAKLRARVHTRSQTNEMLMEGVCSIVEGMNPRMIARKLQPFVSGATRRTPVPIRRESGPTRVASA